MNIVVLEEGKTNTFLLKFSSKKVKLFLPCLVGYLIIEKTVSLFREYSGHSSSNFL